MAENKTSNKTSDSVSFEKENKTAEEHINQADLVPAARILVDVVQKDPQNFRAYNNMGIIAWMRKSWHDAYDMFKKSVEIKPDYADALINLFDAALKLKRIDQVLPDFERALEINPDLEEIKVIVETITEEGDAVYQSKRALAIGVFSPALEEAHKLLDDGKLYQAMDKYLQINDTEGPNAEAFNGLGVVSYYQKRYPDAFTLFVESIKLNPVKQETFMNMLDAAKKCDLVDKAREIHKLYCESVPSLAALEEDFANARPEPPEKEEKEEKQ